MLGIAGTRRLGPLTVGAYAGQRQAQPSVGGTLTFQGPQGQLGLNLDRTGSAVTAGLGGELRGPLGPGTAGVTGAVALNLTTGTAAAQAQGSYQTPAADLNLQYAGATAGWKGAATPTRSVAASLTLRPSPALTLGLQVGAQGGEVLTPRLSASASVRRAFGQVDLNYLSTPTTQSVSGALGHTWQDTPLRHQITWTAPSASAGAQLAYQLSATRRQGSLQLLPTVGVSHDLRSGQTTLSGGLRADYRASAQSAYSVSVASTNLMAGQFSAELSATHTPPDRATSTLSAKVSRQDTRWRAEVRASVNLALDLPVQRRTDLARLEGRILLPGGAGAPGLLLRAGDLAAETDAQGRFVFEALPAGTVALSLLGGTLPPGTQLEPTLPLLLDLRAQETRRLEVRGLQTATLSGRIQVQLPERSSEPGVREALADEVPALTRLSFELTAPGQSPVTVSPNPDGSFRFVGLLPGTYTLRLCPDAEALLVGQALPAPVDVTLHGGEEQALEINLLWRPREVRIDEVQDLTPAPLPPQAP
ncbi:hypothetical protein [Deinococcus multiflagellatus]|uniref:Carboxypeptidase regulatory-like domain-containing protein n=2 Tax=Deinococcus multiflagellatus TaxID=1656887 RepID=A0ABW1ZJ13_9DEIO